jgi:hypothetical protein
LLSKPTRPCRALRGRSGSLSRAVLSAGSAQPSTRRRFLPDLGATYAGCVVWRGTLDEADAAPDLVRFVDDAFTFSEAKGSTASLTATC